jgi:hypothetical protein
MRIDRNDRVQVYMSGDFTGGLMNTPVDITLDKLPDDAFATAKQLLETLGNAGRSPLGRILGLEPAENSFVGDFGYSVRVGNKGDNSKSLCTIFQGSFVPQPKVVVELDKLLKAHAQKPDLVLKP